MIGKLIRHKSMFISFCKLREPFFKCSFTCRPGLKNPQPLCKTIGEAHLLSTGRSIHFSSPQMLRFVNRISPHITSLHSTTLKFPIRVWFCSKCSVSCLYNMTSKNKLKVHLILCFSYFNDFSGSCGQSPGRPYCIKRSLKK